MNFSEMLAGWYADPAWRADARALVPLERRRILAEIGELTFAANIGNYASELRWNAALVAHIYTAEERERLLGEHARLYFAALSDALDFADHSARASEAEVLGADNLTQALARGRGVILVGAYQSHPGYCLCAPPLADYRIGVIRRASEAHAGSMTLDGLPPNVEELPADIRAIPHLLNLLAAGQVVAAYADYVYPGSAPIESALFGRRYPVSKALLHLAKRSGAALVPISIVRRMDSARDGVTATFHPPIAPPPGSDDLALPRLALLLGVALECLIRGDPASWRLWNTLRDRCST